MIKLSCRWQYYHLHHHQHHHHHHQHHQQHHQYYQHQNENFQPHYENYQHHLIIISVILKTISIISSTIRFKSNTINDINVATAQSNTEGHNTTEMFVLKAHILIITIKMLQARTFTQRSQLCATLSIEPNIDIDEDYINTEQEMSVCVILCDNVQKYDNKDNTADMTTMTRRL